MGNKSKKNLIISSISLGVAAIGVTTTLVSCKNDNNEESKNITFTNESIINLKDTLISMIDNEKLTKEEFNDNLLTNIKNNFIINNINIGNSIIKAILTDQNIIQLTLNNKNFEYSVDPNFDDKLATLDLNQNLLSIQLDVTNSSFYTKIDVSNLNSLKSTIENYINETNNIFTSSEFTNQLNSDSFKSVIANAINIQSESIGTITFIDNILTIAPNSNSKVKFSSTLNQDMIKFGSIKVNLVDTSFYTAINVSNLNSLQSTIKNYIDESNNLFTSSEFTNQLNSDSFKSVIANAINIQSNSIGSIAFVDNTLTIAPNSKSKVKFSSTSNKNMIEFGTIKVNILDSSFYQEISFNSGVLEKLRNDIINKINNNEINGSNIESKIVDLINDIKTNDNKDLSKYISTPTYSSNSINITLKDDIGKYKFKNINNIPDILITSNSIILSNMPLLQSPLEWFNLSGNEIISLTDEGKKQKSIILPSIVTSIANNVFANNTIIKSVDMSLTRITTIPNGVGGISLFYNCSSLTSIILPNGLNSIGNSTFMIF